MVKQISLDAWQIQHLAELLRNGSDSVAKTNTPIILYRQTFEEEDSSYEEVVCTLTKGYVIEQLVTSGGVWFQALINNLSLPLMNILKD